MKNVGIIAGNVRVWEVDNQRLYYFDDNDDLVRVDEETERAIWATETPNLELLQRMREGGSSTKPLRYVGMTDFLLDGIHYDEYNSRISDWLSAQPKLLDEFVHRVTQIALTADGLPPNTSFQLVGQDGDEHDD